jgi:phage/plasmid-associated DNA primase
MFRCSPKYLGDEAHFVELGKHLARGDVIRAFYQSAMKRDLSSYASKSGFQRRRPETEFYLEAQMRAISTTNSFLSAIVNTEGSEETYTGDGLYALYLSFCRDRGQELYKKSMTSFGADVKKVGGVSVTRKQRGMKYTVDKEAVRTYLLREREFNNEAFLTRTSPPTQF